jgi:hypothetical protein
MVELRVVRANIKTMILTLIISFGIVASAKNVEAHTITIPPNVYFHLWQQNTYINFASTTTLDNLTQTNDKLYLNQYWFSVENANLTISKFFTTYQLIFIVDAPSQNTSITRVYVDDWGQPTSVCAANATLTWSYDASTKILEFEIIHSSSVETTVDWRIPGDVNGDGIIDISDLSTLNEAYGSKSSNPNWNLECDFNRDSRVDASDLFDLARNYGRIFDA